MFLVHELRQGFQDHGLNSSLHVDAVGVKRMLPHFNLA